VTTRKQSQVLGSTPAALISAAPDLDALRKDFVLEPGGSKDGIEWVTGTPKFKEGQLARVKIGFRGNDLAALEILDSFGQTSVLTFNHMEVNAAVTPASFQFKPPQGVDVVKQ
jgi:outer membrane lipoprotein carrier protein